MSSSSSSTPAGWAVGSEGSAFHHVSVLANEVITALRIIPSGTYLDCTLGGGGHAKLIAQRLSPAGKLIGIDRDAAATTAAAKTLQPLHRNIEIVHANFNELDTILDRLNVSEIDGALFDLGVSSYQIDTAARGFSYMRDAPLDMRMDTTQALTARDVVNGYSEAELVRVLSSYGEERYSKRIAKAIVSARRNAGVSGRSEGVGKRDAGKRDAGAGVDRRNDDISKRNEGISTTGELVSIIEGATPKVGDGGHPAKRVFQAIRIEVNQELESLGVAVTAAIRRLRIGGRIAVITFHSLEDRIVKNTFKDLARGCTCPKSFPVCICGHKPEIKILGKPITPTAAEINTNSRAKPAKLRVAEKIS